ncbi:ACP S-malonyltransferase [Nocardiopsis sediminis]|uniref:[acyl-carrier-protein] S-malonyltransferase n=1 Tax=Nocardiopsis sediminis TaxID=1778267 RepID=A0ABV8FUF9_9ACTN
MEFTLEPETAVVFPGMGPTQAADAVEFMKNTPEARRLTAVADDVLGYSLADRLLSSDDDYSEAAQVAFVVNSLALAEWALDSYGIEPAVCVGPSFGGRAAAVFSGALTAEEGIGLAAELARRTEEYFATEHGDIVTLSFVRVPPEALKGLLAELDERSEWHDVACVIDSDFTMLSLRESRADWLKQRVRAIGGLPLYTMRPPMHSAAFGGLRASAEEAMAGLTFADPRLPVVDDHDGTVLTTGEEVRTLLLDTFTRALHWPDAVASLKGLGVRSVCVCGQDALFGRVAITRNTFRVAPVTPKLVAMRAKPATAT